MEKDAIYSPNLNGKLLLITELWGQVWEWDRFCVIYLYPNFTKAPGALGYNGNSWSVCAVLVDLSNCGRHSRKTSTVTFFHLGTHPPEFDHP
jgi:hypothetical protein